MDMADIKRILPHREPFLFVDDITAVSENSVDGYHEVKNDEFWTRGHFPGNPIVPGVIQCEMMAQSACVLFADRMSGGTLPVYTGIDKVRFRGMVRPGDRIRIDTKTLRSCPPLYALHSELTVDGKRCASGDLSFAIVEA